MRLFHPIIKQFAVCQAYKVKMKSKSSQNVTRNSDNFRGKSTTYFQILSSPLTKKTAADN